MIDRIVIPTYNRIETQKTWKLLPKKWRQITDLVVTPNEAPWHIDRGRNVVITHEQGKGVYFVRKFILQRYAGQRIIMLDDDIYSIEIYNHWINDWSTIYGGEDEGFDIFFEVIDRALDTYDRVGIADPELELDPMSYSVNAHTFAVFHAFDLGKIPKSVVNSIRTDLSNVGEDTYISLHMLAHGSSHIYLHNYRWQADAFVAGGLEGMRRLEDSYHAHCAIADLYEGITVDIEKSTPENPRVVMHCRFDEVWESELE